MERASGVAASEGGVGLRRFFEGAVGAELDDGVELGVDLGYAVEVGLYDLDGGYLLVADGLGYGGGRGVDDVGHGSYQSLVFSY